MTIPRKTDAAHQRLRAPRQSLAPGVRMLLIVIDGRKTLAELAPVAQGLGLSDEAFEQLRAEGLIAWDGSDAPQKEAAPAERVRRLVRAKFFALDLAARMLAGQDQRLREQARHVESESTFDAWLDDCAEAIAQAGGAERGALFRARVAAAAG